MLNNSKDSGKSELNKVKIVLVTFGEAQSRNLMLIDLKKEK